MTIVLRLRRAAPDWTKGKCLGQATGPDFDPWSDNEEYGYENQQELGLGICNGTEDGIVCPLRNECLLFALVNNERFGVWGGTSEIDRRALRKMWPWDSSNPSEPRPEWQWYAPGEVARLLPSKGRAALNEEEDDDDEDGEAQ